MLLHKACKADFVYPDNATLFLAKAGQSLEDTQQSISSCCFNISATVVFSTFAIVETHV